MVVRDLERWREKERKRERTRERASGGSKKQTGVILLDKGGASCENGGKAPSLLISRKWRRSQVTTRKGRRF